MPKTKKAYCKGKECKKHTLHKVTQYKTGKASLYAQGERGVLLGRLPDPGLDAVLDEKPLNHSLPSPYRKEALRPQAVRLRWSDQACLPQEGMLDDHVVTFLARTALGYSMHAEVQPCLGADTAVVCLPLNPQAKTTRKIVLRLQCQQCKTQHMHAIKVNSWLHAEVGHGATM